MHKSAHLLSAGVFSLLLGACSVGGSGTGPCEDCPAGHACVDGACVPIDSDGDRTPDLTDACPTDANKVAPGTCGCGKVDSSDDSDADGTLDCLDGCPNDIAKVAPGACGCGAAETDSDGDGAADCIDGCPADVAKTAAGACGCGVADTDSDSDGTANCNDGCPSDIGKTAAGLCGCGVADTDSDGDGTEDCHDGCPNDLAKVAAGICGCGVADTDSDSDGTANCHDGCPNDLGKTAAGLCGCGVADTDSDSDGTPNCLDACPNDGGKTAAGVCGCGAPDVDTDGDSTLDCNDGCPKNAGKLAPDTCGCGELVATWSVPSRNLSALAYANGVLYATDLNTNPRSIIGFDGAGVASTVATLGTYTTVSLAASPTHLYVDDEAAQQTIHEISIATGQQTRTFKSALNGGNRGLGYSDGTLWHLGYVTSVGVTFLPIDVATGTAGTPISPKPADAVFSDAADATDDALLYVTRVDNYCSSSCPTVLHAIDPTGTPICTQALGNTTSEVNGLAVGDGRFYIVSERKILVFR